MFNWLKNAELMDEITLLLFRSYLITSFIVGIIVICYFTRRTYIEKKEHEEIMKCLEELNKNYAD